MNNPQDSSKLAQKIEKLKAEVVNMTDITMRLRADFARVWMRDDLKHVTRPAYPDSSHIPQYQMVEVDGYDAPQLRLVIDGQVCDGYCAWDLVGVVIDRIEEQPEHRDLWERVFFAVIDDPIFPEMDRRSVAHAEYYMSDDISARAYSDHYGVDEGGLHKIIGTWRHHDICIACDSDYYIEVTTRQELEEACKRMSCPKCPERPTPHDTDKFQWDETDPEHRRTMPYKLYLQTNHWKETRQHALARAGHRCQLCNGNERLEVHHRTYDRRGAEHLTDLTVLCAKCHSKFHGE